MSEVDYSKYPGVNFRSGEQLERMLTERGENKNTVAKRDLQRYYDLLARNLPVFTIQEALLLCDALNGVRCTSATLYGNIGAVIEQDNLDEKYRVDRSSFMVRIHDLSDVESQSVIDAVERAWNTPEYSVNLKQRVLLVGLAK